MKKKIIAALLVLVACLFVGCTKDFEYGSDKFYLEEVGTYGKLVPRYSFVKKIDSDMILEPYDRFDCPQGYRLYGDSLSGHWDYMGIHNKDLSEGDSPEIHARFVCYSEEGMGDAKLNIYFNYTVASTGERVEEVWEVDFGQKPYKDKR